MKRPLIALIALLIVTNVANVPAWSLPGGPDGDVYGSGYFEIHVVENLNGNNPPPEPRDVYSITSFDLSEGWDFGDRFGYECAWGEFFLGGDEKFEVHYELVEDYPFDVQINDKFGRELSDTDAPPDAGSGSCGTGIGKGGIPTHDGSDHFPHGTSFLFYKDDVEIASIDYELEHADGCDSAYWSPGDEPGEAWLWWDEDGPQQHHPGGPIVCPGGSVEPVAVVRAIVQNVDPDIGYCTRDEMDGSQCQGPSPTHASDVDLNLRRNGRASGRVSSPDTACLQDRTVVVQRRISREWRTRGRTLSSSDGSYSLEVRPREGRYRSMVLERELPDGSFCLSATSRSVRLRR